MDLLSLSTLPGELRQKISFSVFIFSKKDHYHAKLLLWKMILFTNSRPMKALLNPVSNFHRRSVWYYFALDSYYRKIVLYRSTSKDNLIRVCWHAYNPKMNSAIAGRYFNYFADVIIFIHSLTSNTTCSCNSFASHNRILKTPQKHT